MKEERERTPLRIILQNFINHVENLETYRSENSYDKEFQDLKLFSENLKTSGKYSSKEGEKEFNRKKNRYKDILPFDYSRVTLSEYVGVPGSDYINANYIKGASGSPAYIASQGPLPHTVNDFWRMVVECEVQVIVMACNEEESGKHKCEKYWVDQEGEEKKFGMVAIRLLKASTICPDFLVRTMQLKYVNSNSVPEERVVCQFHYGAWPDHGVPGLVRPLLEMVRLVRDTQASETLPVLVHCSAGCGRTGTICAIDYVWGLLRAGKLRLDFSLFKLVRDMRKQRIAMVQTKDQYILVHQAVRELFQDQLRMIHSHPYENIDVRGHPLLPSISPKATIIQPRRTVSSDEKQDGREKESGIVCCTIMPEQASVINSMDTGNAPPLPHKKRIHTVSSKQEKEVENLTQKQLSIASASGNTKVQSSCVGGTFDKGDGQVIAMLEKNLKITSPETCAKGIDKASNVDQLLRSTDLTKNPLSSKPLFLAETMKTSLNCLPINSMCDVHHSLTANQTEGTSNLHKPRIAKLKALFESNTHVKDCIPNVLRSAEAKPRLPQLVTRSHSLGAVRKPHKFTQFNDVSPEIGIQSQQSNDQNESGRYKSASNIHTDICGPKVRDIDEITYTKLNTDLLNKPCSSSNNPIVHNKSETSSIVKPLSPYLHLTGGKLVPSSSFSGVLYPHEKNLGAVDSYTPSLCASPGDLRPALPIKRSKSLKVQSTADHFKLSLAKRSHGINQELSSSEDDSNFSLVKLECNTEKNSHQKNSKECENLSHGCEASCSSIPNMKMPCKCLVLAGTVRINSAGSTVIQTLELKDLPSRPTLTDVNSEVEPVNKITPLAAPIRINNDSETFTKFPEWKKVGGHVPKLSRDICRAQSLHLKRERTSPHISLAHSQESEYVNVKKVDSVGNARHPIEPLNVRILSADDICKCVDQSQLPNSMPIDASNIIEDCRNYLLSEGLSFPNFNESQRIAAASARHKVDTVAGGLGIRERRNSFRCAVGQGVDEKHNWTEVTDGGSKWLSRNAEPHSGLCAEEISVKRQFESKLTNTRIEIVKLQKKPSDRPKGVESNVISKNSPLFQKPCNTNQCKYVANVVKSGEKPGELNNVQKADVRLMEARPVSGDVAQKNMGMNEKKPSVSSSYQISSPPVWKHSVATRVKKSSYVPSKPSPKSSQRDDLVLSSPKASMYSGVRYLWPSHQANVPQKKGNSSAALHSVENLGAQSNHNSVIPLEVDVDQVAASMRNNLQGKLEGAKSPVSLEHSNQGNNSASTHFTRALEVFHQTAASIRTKFSRPAVGSGAVLVRSLESSSKGEQSPQNHPSLFRPQPNGNPKREVRNASDVGDQPKILRKQQQYL